jgi:RNA polymerase sigma-70 factor, ECF subfamily
MIQGWSYGDCGMRPGADSVDPVTELRDGARPTWRRTGPEPESRVLSNTIAAAVPSRPDRQQAVTRLLSQWQSGDSHALERLTPLIYEELRDRARRYMRRERPGHTLQATAVVHEAFVKLVEMNVSWQDRAHFFAVAARQMRRILVDHAKARCRSKRNGNTTGNTDVEILAELDSDPASAGDIDVLEIDEALQRLASHNPRLAEIVELHYFGGLTYQELAETLKVSEATVDRDLRLAKAWVLKQIRPQRSFGSTVL